MTISRITIKSQNKKSLLQGLVYQPEGTPKATLQISHGMVEHIDRYRPLMSFLAKKGFLIFGHDHLGHGKTVGLNEPFGYFGSEEGYRFLIKDLYTVGEIINRDYPDIPHFLLGHSMGSFIARLTVLASKSSYDGLILSGTGGSKKFENLTLGLLSFLKKVQGGEKASPTLDRLVFKSYNKKIKNPKTSKDWLTRDEAIVKAYRQDPFCQILFTNSAWKDLAQLSKDANRPEWYENLPGELPILLISGTDDPVGDYGNGVTEIYKKLKQQGHKVQLKLYLEGRHEMFNEINAQEVYEDLYKWLEEML